MTTTNGTITHSAENAALRTPFGSGTDVSVQLRYDRANPHAVTISLEMADTPRGEAWYVDREVLAQGIWTPVTAQACEGITIYPRAQGGSAVLITRRAPGDPDNYLTLQLDRAFLEEFLIQTLEVVPLGEESTHLQPALEQFLAETLGDD